MIPVYVVCGFLGAGKSSLINEQLRLRQKMASTAVFAFEEGATALQNLADSFTVEDVERTANVLYPKEIDCVNADNTNTSTIDVIDTATIPERISNYIKQHQPKEIWMEWNGTLPFPQLEAILCDSQLNDMVRIERVIFVATEYHMNTLLPAMGNILRSQLYNADVMQVHSTSTDVLSSAKEIHAQLCRPQLPWALYGITAMLTAYLLLVILFRHDIPYALHQMLAVTSGLILEGIPFLLLGTVVATAIRLFVPDRVILRYLQGDSCKSYALAMVSGLALPVCDCATIPMFKTLLDKGVPQHIALLFMLASPIMNPIAILATYYAFPNDESIVIWRIGLGLVVALLVSLSFKFRPFTLARTRQSALVESNYIYNSPPLEATKKRLFLFHTEREFLQLLSYFSIAAFVIAIFQVWLKPLMLAQDWSLPMLASHLVLLGFAFIFSLCSTSDAIIGRSLSSLFPLSSVLGFLVLGPMMDIKNAYILNQYIGATFTQRLAFTIFIVTFIIIALFQFLIN